jgi:lantibiotic modifying enzyme
MITRLCGMVHERVLVTQVLACHRPELHLDDCSWQQIKLADQKHLASLVPKTQWTSGAVIDAINDVLVERAINDGALDKDIEAILAAGHGRKREMRNINMPYGMRRH